MPSKTTRKSKALKLRRKLKKETSTKRKYVTKYKDIKDYFKLLVMTVSRNISATVALKLKFSWGLSLSVL